MQGGIFMKAKDILKSPLYLITLTLCICLAVAFLIFEVSHEDESVDIEDKKLDIAYTAVLEKFDFSEEEIDSFSVTYERNTETDVEGSYVYQVITIADEETRNFTVTLFLNGTVNVIENKTGEDTDSEEASSNSISQTSGSNASSSSAKEYSTKSKYADIELVKEYVLLDSKLDSDEINFISVELNKSSEPPIYEIVFETTNGYRKYIYHANALNGLLRDRTYYNADDVVDEANIFMIKEGKNAKYYDVIWDNSDGYNVPDGKRGSQSFYGDPVFVEGYSG